MQVNLQYSSHLSQKEETMADANDETKSGDGDCGDT